jgi:hypothetical protein
LSLPSTLPCAGWAAVDSQAFPTAAAQAEIDADPFGFRVYTELDRTVFEVDLGFEFAVLEVAVLFGVCEFLIGLVFFFLRGCFVFLAPLFEFGVGSALGGDEGDRDRGGVCGPSEGAAERERLASGQASRDRLFEVLQRVRAAAAQQLRQLRRVAPVPVADLPELQREDGRDLCLLRRGVRDRQSVLDADRPLARSQPGLA